MDVNVEKFKCEERKLSHNITNRLVLELWYWQMGKTGYAEQYEKLHKVKYFHF